MDEVFTDPFVVHSGPSRLWTAELVRDLLNRIGERQVDFLAALYSVDGHLTASFLIERMGVGSQVVLAGVISGLNKQISKLSIDSLSLYQAHSSKHQERSYRLNPDLRQRLMEIGWPAKGQSRTRRF